ncbi:redoxin domain-containing protein [Texcoconibacillus texcoconensis]|uniref:Peroxiredoxin n=1 Tax=Texcoconibacillus texcoconensis TaxID=1095777 RepID=A0A840QQ95_9BACI|nr:peroxiredoxin [Texcoconibacillus texcoconensis]
MSADNQNFGLYDLQSEQYIKLEDFLEKPVLLTFWASWCPDSHIDLKHKEQLYRSMNKESLGFLTINVTGREHRRDELADYIDKNEWSFPILSDEGTKTYDAYRCMSVPTTIVLDKDHQIVGHFNDRSSFQEILQALTKVV